MNIEKRLKKMQKLDLVWVILGQIILMPLYLLYIMIYYTNIKKGQKSKDIINYSYILSHALLPLISLFIFYFLDLEKFNEKY